MNNTAHIDVSTFPPAAMCPASATMDASGSSLADLSRLLGLPAIEDGEHIRFLRRRVKAGQWIFATGEALEGIFAVYAGSAKTLLIDAAGNEQILGFPQKGDLLGMDGIFSARHTSHAIALTDCELIVIPFNDLARLGPAALMLENWLFRATSRELSREHVLVGLLGTLSADARVSRFLVSLSERFAAAGYSATAFRLAMTRKDIGSYLGLTLETASRTLSALDAAGYIRVDQREVEIRDMHALRTLDRIVSPGKVAVVKHNASAGASRHHPAGTSDRRPSTTASAGSIWGGLAA